MKLKPNVGKYAMQGANEVWYVVDYTAQFYGDCDNYHYKDPY